MKYMMKYRNQPNREIPSSYHQLFSLYWVFLSIYSATMDWNRNGNFFFALLLWCFLNRSALILKGSQYYGTHWYSIKVNIRTWVYSIFFFGFIPNQCISFVAENKKSLLLFKKKKLRLSAPICHVWIYISLVFPFLFSSFSHCLFLDPWRSNFSLI